ncbi:hypothetical protein [Paraeggerthella hongkongensis]|nr:hypothetical protein [Paraeggerthella hongkongensis]
MIACLEHMLKHVPKRASKNAPEMRAEACAETRFETCPRSGLLEMCPEIPGLRSMKDFGARMVLSACIKRAGEKNLVNQSIIQGAFWGAQTGDFVPSGGMSAVELPG